MLNDFKWYRALRGGVWYKNEIKIDKTGLGEFIYSYQWTRNSILIDTSLNDCDSVEVIETEDYRDPVKHCEVYKKKGCSHVDGMCCNMNDCLIRKQNKNEKIRKF